MGKMVPVSAHTALVKSGAAPGAAMVLTTLSGREVIAKLDGGKAVGLSFEKIRGRLALVPQGPIAPVPVYKNQAVPFSG